MPNVTDWKGLTEIKQLGSNPACCSTPDTVLSLLGHHTLPNTFHIENNNISESIYRRHILSNNGKCKT